MEAVTNTDLAGFAWHCEPEQWTLDEGWLRVQPDASTDFWQRTHYGFQADNGHFFYREVKGDFAFSARVYFDPAHQYDQAGIMVRVSADCWLKSSVEYDPPGPPRLGAVVTNHGYSDWSSQDFPMDVKTVWLRVRREGDDYLVDWCSDGQQWRQLRMAHLHAGRDGSVACGPYACSPKAGGFACEFTEVSLTVVGSTHAVSGGMDQSSPQT